MQAILYNFTKRNNSTKQPTDAGATKNVVLKDNCSLLNPVFKINEVNLSYNYMKWENRYYFINDIVPINNTVAEYHCSMDVLATHKTDVGNYTAFVERSSSSYDVMVNDENISQKQNIISRHITYTDISATAFDSRGTYFIRVASGSGSSFTGIDTFAIPPSGINSVLSWIYSPDAYDFLTDEVAKAVFDPAKFIIDIYWLPVSPTLFTVYVPFKLGLWTPTGSDERPVISTPGITFTQQVSIYNNYYTDFRAFNNKWTNLRVYLPGIGQIEIDPIVLQNSNVLNVTFDLDFATGDVVTRITSGSSSENDNNVISIQKGNWAVPIQIGSSNFLKDYVSNGVSAMASLASGNLSGVVNGITGAVSSILSPSVSVLGDIGNMQTFSTTSELKKIICTLINYESCDIPRTTAGRPLYQNKAINTLSGYVKCSNASVPISGMESEREAVNSALNTGFYYE